MSLWPAVHAERRALCDDLEQLHGQQWAVQSLCGRWTAEEVVAHLTAAASTGRLRWLASMVGARFDSSLHNQRRMAEQRGADPDETLQSFRRIVTSSTAPSGHVAAWLGEVVVHGQDIRRPLGIEGAPPVDRITEVADFFAGRDFTVKSRTAIKASALRLWMGPSPPERGLWSPGRLSPSPWQWPAVPRSATTSTETVSQPCAAAVGLREQHDRNIPKAETPARTPHVGPCIRVQVSARTGPVKLPG